MLSKKQRQIFTIEDWKEANRLERLYIHLLQPDDFELDYEDEDYLDALKQVWTILGKTMAKMKQVSRIVDLIGVTTRTAFKYIDDAQALFGEILKTDAEMELSVMKERYYRLADKAEKSGDYDTARRCMDSAQTIIEKLEARKPKQQRVFAAVIFTDDPKALTAQHDGDEIDFEELGAQSLLEQQAIAVPSGVAAD
jgi:cell division protein ZapA (FtsZ GTPase activity inhibitor)